MTPIADAIGASDLIWVLLVVLLIIAILAVARRF